MKVSIVIPVYNGEKYIERSIRSALQQVFSDIEVIVVNDGSTDGTLNVIRSLAESDCRIKMIDQPNKGVNAARQTGIQASDGDWICFLDSDDTLPLDAVDKYIKFATDKCDIIASGFPEEIQSSEDYICYIQKMKIRPELWGKMFSRKLLDDFYPFLDRDIVMGEDFLINLVLALHAEDIITIPELLYHINLNNPDSITKRFKRTEEYEYTYFSLFKELFLSKCSTMNSYSVIIENVFKSRVDGFKSIVLAGNGFDPDSEDWKEIRNHFHKDSSALGLSERLLLRMDRFQVLYRWIMKLYLSIR